MGVQGPELTLSSATPECLHNSLLFANSPSRCRIRSHLPVQLNIRIHLTSRLPGVLNVTLTLISDLKAGSISFTKFAFVLA